jgi:hypothetical protein
MWARVWQQEAAGEAAAAGGPGPVGCERQGAHQAVEVLGAAAPSAGVHVKPAGGGAGGGGGRRLSAACTKPLRACAGEGAAPPRSPPLLAHLTPSAVHLWLRWPETPSASKVITCRRRPKQPSGSGPEAAQHGGGATAARAARRQAAGRDPVSAWPHRVGLESIDGLLHQLPHDHGAPLVLHAVRQLRVVYHPDVAGWHLQVGQGPVRPQRPQRPGRGR